MQILDLLIVRIFKGILDVWMLEVGLKLQAKGNAIAFKLDDGIWRQAGTNQTAVMYIIC